MPLPRPGPVRQRLSQEVLAPCGQQAAGQPPRRPFEPGHGRNGAERFAHPRIAHQPQDLLDGGRPAPARGGPRRVDLFDRHLGQREIAAVQGARGLR